MSSRREFLAATALPLFAQNHPASQTPPAGVVLIVADQRRSPWLNAPDDDGAAAIRELAARARRFLRCWTACPAHEPGRDAVLTGRYPHLGGLTATPGGSDLYECFAAAGWRTARGQDARAVNTLVQAGQRYLGVLEPAANQDVSCVRSVFDLLRARGALEDTLVVFTSTRGAAEDVWYEQATRVPLLFQWPRRIAPEAVDVLASGVDVLPTILGLCGLPVPDGAQGRSLARSSPESIYAEGRIGKRDEWRMIVRGLDKIVFETNLRILRLYNLGQDPEEKSDLSGARSEQRKRDELLALAGIWMRRLDDHVDPSGLKRRPE